MNSPSDIAPVDRRACALLERVAAYGFSAPDDPLGFESRLADDQGWTLGYALAVVDEYRRFLVLTQVAGQSVSPSPDVDEAWHLHLTRTTHYEAFCAALFGKFLHHEPARPGEGARHRDMYRETLEAYRRAFGVEAPVAIWPVDGRRIEAMAAAEADWDVPGLLRPGRRLALVAVLGSIALGLLLRDLGVLDALQEIPPFTFLGVALLLTVALAWLGLRARPAPARAAERDLLEPYEAAWLSGGAQRMAMTAVVALTERGVLLAPGKPQERGPRPPIPVNMTVEPRCAHPAEVACLSGIRDGSLRFGAACQEMQPVADEVGRRLIAAGIADDADALPRRRARALLAMAVLLVIECERIGHVSAAHHRVGLLVLLTLLDIVLVFLLARRRRSANSRAESALRPLRMDAGATRKSPAVGQALAFGVALAGGATMAGDLRFDGLQQQINAMPMAALARRKAAGRADGSGGSSCSSCGSSDAGSGGGDAGGGSSCSSSSCSSGGSSCGGGGD